MTVAPYGSWKSPIGIEQVLGASVGLMAIGRLGEGAAWLEARPGQNGRLTLVTQGQELTPSPVNVRTRVMEYGGGAWHADGEVFAYSNDDDRRVWVSDAQGLRPITPERSDFRYGDLRVHADLGVLLAVREDHHGEGEAVTTLVSLDLASGNEDGGKVLVAGASFYAHPELAHGQLAWVEWNHPDMPWDATRLLVAPCDGHEVGDPVIVAGGAEQSAVHPQWAPDGTLYYLCDANGYWTPWAWDGSATREVYSAQADFARPVWVLGSDRFAVVDDQRLLVTWYQDGLARLGVLGTDGTMREVPGTFADVDGFAVQGETAWVVLDHTDRPGEVAELDLGSLQLTTLRSAGEAPDARFVPQPESIWFEGAHGRSQAWWYPPTNPDFRAPEGELPPVIVNSHGGPTGMAPADYKAAFAYWTSRGFGIVDVNYSGSAGFGRAYRNRLYGKWGVADVDDCVSAVDELVERELADPERIAIRGGSAGGYTTLQALVTSEVFAAGVSSYGIGDLEMLATDTHKFEARYLDRIVGPYPEQQELYVHRSPIHHVDRLSSPMLILQGLDDKVVPPNQAEAMADALRAKGLPVALMMFEGEGHGFRKESTRKAVLEAQQSFFAQLFGFTPADEIPQLEVENLRPGVCAARARPAGTAQA